MKNTILLLLVSLLFNSCVKQLPIPQEELTGIWKLNGYQSTTYVMEFTKDGYVYWFNYYDIPSDTREFELEFDSDRNRAYLYKPGRTNPAHEFKIYQQKNGRLYFSVVNSAGIDPDGNPISRTDTYYQMN